MWLSTRAAGFANLMVGYRGDRREYIFLPNQKCRFDSEDSIGIIVDRNLGYCIEFAHFESLQPDSN